MLTSVVDALTLVDTIITDFEFPDWTQNGIDLITSLIDGISSSLLGTRDEVTPFGMIIPGEEGALSGLLDTGKRHHCHNFHRSNIRAADTIRRGIRSVRLG